MHPHTLGNACAKPELGLCYHVLSHSEWFKDRIQARRRTHIRRRDAILEQVAKIEGVFVYPVLSGNTQVTYRVFYTAEAQKQLNRVVHVYTYNAAEAVRDEMYCYFFEPVHPVWRYSSNLIELLNDPSIILEAL